MQFMHSKHTLFSITLLFSCLQIYIYNAQAKKDDHLKVIFTFSKENKLHTLLAQLLKLFMICSCQLLTLLLLLLLLLFFCFFIIKSLMAFNLELLNQDG